MKTDYFHAFQSIALRADIATAFGAKVLRFAASKEVKGKKNADVGALFRAEDENMKHLRALQFKEKEIKQYKGTTVVEIFIVRTEPPEPAKAHKLLFEEATSVFKKTYKDEFDFFDWLKRGKPERDDDDQHWLETVQRRPAVGG